MGATVAFKTRFSYSPQSLRYRDNATGRFVSTGKVKRAVDTVIRKSSNEMRSLAQDLADRKITLGAWQERFAAEMKNLHVSNAMAGAGGMRNMTQQDYGRVGQRLRFEYQRLELLAQALKRREFTEGELMNRVEMYVASGNTSYAGARGDAAVNAGFNEERNVLGNREKHCETGKGRVGCLNLTRQGWVNIRTLTPVGQRRCISRCGCYIRYRRRSTA